MKVIENNFYNQLYKMVNKGELVIQMTFKKLYLKSGNEIEKLKFSFEFQGRDLSLNFFHSFVQLRS